MKLILKTILINLTLLAMSFETSGYVQLDQRNNARGPIGFTIYGTGPQHVIILHDWMGDSENWLPLLPYSSLDTYTYAFMDVRGYGKSKDIKGAYNSTEIAEDILQLADHLEWPQFHLIGHSMTGMAVQKAAILDHSNRILSVIAVTPVPAKGFPLDQENKQFFLSIINNRKVAEMGYNAMTGMRLTENWQKSRAQRFLEKVDPVACKGYLEMWSNENFASETTGIEIPFLVIAGKHDHPGFQMEAQKKNFKGFKNITFIENLNAGHYPMEETPIFLATTIEQFLYKHQK